MVEDAPTAPGAARAVEAARRHVAAHGGAIVRELADLVALPNVSRDLDAVARNADAIAGSFAARGIDLDVVTIAGAAPVVTGRIRGARSGARIGLYVHYDGQPVDDPAWVDPPFAPVLRDAPLERGGRVVDWPRPDGPVDPDLRLYGRSTADDKAPIVALLAALDALRAGGLDPAGDVALLFEGEEEIGSPHLPTYLERLRERLDADVWLVCDGSVHHSGRPQIAFGARGFAALELTVYGPARDLHSGHYGNWAPSPTTLLIHLLAGLKDRDGTVRVPGFHDRGDGLADVDRAAIAALPAFDDDLRRELALPSTEGGGAPLAARLLLPSLNVRGVRAADVGDAARNVIPAEARASIDLRLVPGDDPAAMLDRVEAAIAARGFHVVREPPDEATRHDRFPVVRVEREVGYPAVRTPLDHPAARPVLAAARAAADEEVVATPIMGGSVPLHTLVEHLGAPVLIAPFANPDNRQHAANENLRVGNLFYGVRLMAALLGS